MPSNLIRSSGALSTPVAHDIFTPELTNTELRAGNDVAAARIESAILRSRHGLW